MIIITENISFDTKKTFENQGQEFKDYFWGKYDATPKIPYQDFVTDGNITYAFTDNILNYSVKRIQRYPFFDSDRSVKELIITINTI